MWLRVIVSRTVLSNLSPSSSAFFFTNPVSNDALCATTMSSPQNSTNLGTMTSYIGASFTMSSFMEVSCSIWYGIGTPGLINSENVSTTSPSFTLTAPISMILLCFFESPVVSISNTTYSESRLWFLEFLTRSLRSSTKYPSTPYIILKSFLSPFV